MNLRYEILKACAANPGAPIDEIADTIKYDHKKTAWAVRDCAKEGLLSKRLDDVTGQLGYTLTAAGKKRLAEGPATRQGSNMKRGDSEGGETDVKPQTAEIPPQITPAIPQDDVERDDALPPADASLLALANRELADRLDADKPLTPRLVEQARDEFDATVARLVDIPPGQVTSAIRTTEIAWEIEKLHRSEAA